MCTDTLVDPLLGDHSLCQLKVVLKERWSLKKVEGDGIAQLVECRAVYGHSVNAVLPARDRIPSGVKICSDLL